MWGQEKWQFFVSPYLWIPGVNINTNIAGRTTGLFADLARPVQESREIKELGAARLMIVHWGTFRLGDEPVHLPPLDIKREMEKEGLADRLVHLNHGETFYLLAP